MHENIPTHCGLDTRRMTAYNSTGKTAILAVLVIFLVQIINYAAEIRSFQRKIVLDQKDKLIAYPTDFCVLEDECFVICDTREHKIIVYDQDGKYLSEWNKFGQGPGEYQGLWFNSYKAPYLAIADLRQPKILMYQRIGKGDFKWIKDIPESGREIKEFLLDSGSFFFDTTILHEKRYYFIHIIDLDGKNDEYLLPAAVRYGGQPKDNYLDIFEAKYRKIWGLPRAFIDVLDGYVYSTWTGNLEILKIGRTNREWMTFGKKTSNYHPLKLEETAIASGQSAKQIFDQKRRERAQYSWVGGLFVDRELTGLLYLTFDRKTSNWVTYLQLYDSNGVFQNEYQLPDVISIDAHLQYFYHRETGFLYFLNTIDQEDKEIGFEILKYKIRE